MNVLILSATASAINYRNSLRDREDLTLYFTDISPMASGFYDDKIQPLIIPRSRDFYNYQAALDRIIREKKIDLLIPTSDHDMEGIAHLKKQGWQPNVKWFTFDPDLLNLYTHKYKVIERLQDLNFTVPRLYKNEAEYTFPLVIKPTREGGSKGVYIIENPNDLATRKAEITGLYGDDIVIQEFVPGDTGSIFVCLLLYGNDGQVYGEAVSYSTLTFMTWGGGGNAGTLVHNPDLIAQGKAIVEALGGWKGPINLEFKQHEGNGKFYLMEINCRLNGYSYLTSMNGLNFPAAVIDLLCKGTTEYLKLGDNHQFTNFITNLRERPVKDWITE